MGWLNIIKKILKNQNSGLVLMYHRVIENSIDPWQLAVSPKNFEDQLQVLKKTDLVTSLHRMIDQLKAGGEIKPSIAITFDDGYADNFLNAKPLLEKYDLPACFFISTKHIGSKKAFWWDDLAAIVLIYPELPEFIKLDFPDSVFTFDLNKGNLLTEEMLQIHKNWNASMSPPTQRASLFLKLWKALSTLSYEHQQVILTTLKESIKYTEDCGENYCMTEEQLISLADNNLFHIGTHTETHPLLSGLPWELQQQEIIKSKEYLEGVLKQKQELFAYPHGNYNALTIDILEKQGFKAALTTQGNKVRANENPYQMGRFQVNNWGKLEFTENLKYWL
ncbi:polysaccharide deacetylase family protein [Cognataquiflexum rubidum]|uniref:polysaccharide deacetylase family protein n=1 Tax=Cognataquiflexum rubidum TaxID=2922273 RepID=UPI001F129895|nr:polysaccharide deacetylase family protein [Cognataquiflexum rubidum]MCH6234051.1 polysaccharide deacetylase family protein [Cognataquiflexum rubidum]